MINLERLQRQTMSTQEAEAAAKAIAVARADLLKIARIASFMNYRSILDIESVKDMLHAVGEGHGN